MKYVAQKNVFEIGFLIWHGIRGTQVKSSSSKLYQMNLIVGSQSMAEIFLTFAHTEGIHNANAVGQQHSMVKFI
jgi:hypothetical protein